MSVFKKSSEIIITCHKFHAPYLEREVQELGFRIEDKFQTGVKIHGTVADCIRLNLHLFCASQVLYSLKKFSAANADQVYQKVKDIAWEELLPLDGYFSVTSNVRNPTVNNSMFANVRVKDAIADRFRDKKGARPATGPETNAAVVHLFWKDNDAEIFLDTSGQSLAKHGYRKIPGAAPMLEALAASTILASKWDRKSAFVNPMCGSGTLAIEAALLASHSKPGLFRANYGFMHLLGFQDDTYDSQRDLLEDQIVEENMPRIIATDHDEDAIVNAKKNAIAAGVADLIEFSVCDFTETEIPAEPGVLFVNPEYGDRLGEIAALEKTYAELGDFMKQKCRGYTGYIFTGNLELAKKIGLKASRRIEFFNGKLDCRLLEYELYAGTRDAKKVTA